MFVQVIRGQVTDPEQVHAALDRWSQQQAPAAPGWLGSTAGVTDDGTFVALARFESAEAARRNDARPEQSQWWSETSRLFSGDVSFQDSEDITQDTPGDPDRAGFVQIMQGRGTDPERAKELMNQNPDEWAAFRPDVLGSMAVGHDGGAYTMAMYFTSEQAAREGEHKEPPPELRAQMDEMGKLSAGEPDFLDLKHPWLYSPR
ncbi:MAG TPA: hypothetical protein VGI64_05335 [Streptosporangiaceae bacterium]|jgi:hypothetical protein